MFSPGCILKYANGVTHYHCVNVSIVHEDYLCLSPQMTPQNLGVCFSPTLFFLANPMLKTNSLMRRGSFKRNTVNPGLSPTQLASHKDVNDTVVSWGWGSLKCGLSGACWVPMVPISVREVERLSEQEYHWEWSDRGVVGPAEV